MAKPKLPKKTNGTNQTVSTNPAPSPDPNPATEAVMQTAPATETKKTTTRKTARKPEIVKTDARANLVPINLDDEIRRLAYLLSERRGFEPGHDAEDWLAAEHEIRQRYRQHSA